MGYYTRHELEVHEGDITINEIYNDWEEGKLIFEGFEYAIDENGECLQETKWYSHRKDMKHLSLCYPNIVFLLSGEGEENDDVWKEYYKNGKYQVCKAKISFDEYDENQLSEIK